MRLKMHLNNEEISIETSESSIFQHVTNVGYDEKEGYAKAIKLPIINCSIQKTYLYNYNNKCYGTIVIPKKGFIENVKALYKRGYSLYQIFNVLENRKRINK